MTPQLEAARISAIRDSVLTGFSSLPKHIGRYEIRGVLGQGGMGVVYDAYDSQLDRVVAIKVIDWGKMGSGEKSARGIAYFEKEMRATSSIFHPNLVAILDAGVVDERAYYAMERVEGESLEERLTKHGALPRKEGLTIAAAIARGLAAVHEHGLVHRDLKPSNVLLPINGEPKLVDFGLCHLRNEVEGSPQAILGSAHYLAPEQVRSEPVSGRADIFSLGAILLRIFTGVDPFQADSLEGHFQRIVGDEPDGLEGLDADIRGLVSKLMVKDPLGRPASASDVADRLETMAQAPAPEFQSDTPEKKGMGHDGTPPARSPRRRGSSPAWWVIGCVLLVLALSFAATRARNELVALDVSVTTHWQQVENQLVRQHELIPPLLAVIDRYVAYETKALQLIADVGREGLRSEVGQSLELRELDRIVINLLRLAERHPSLKADQHYRALSFEIVGTKNRIAVERMRYNEVVGELNQRLDQFPWSLFAGSLTKREYFDPSPEETSDPTQGL